jgi:hypothetical protein
MAEKIAFLLTKESDITIEDNKIIITNATGVGSKEIYDYNITLKGASTNLITKIRRQIRETQETGKSIL